MSVDYTKARNAYRKRQQQRQTMIFGSIAVVLALLMLLASAWWIGLVPFPASKEFTRSKPTGPITPCVAAGTPSTENSAITVNIYNSTSRTGLARAVGNKLTEFDVTVNTEGNWNGEPLTEAAVIYTSPAVVAEAYTLHRMFPDASIVLNHTTTSQVIDVVIGESFTKLKGDNKLKELAAGQELTPLPNCTPVDG